MTRVEFRRMERIGRDLESVQKYELVGLKHPYIKESKEELINEFNKLFKKYNEYCELKEGF